MAGWVIRSYWAASIYQRDFSAAEIKNHLSGGQWHSNYWLTANIVSTPFSSFLRGSQVGSSSGTTPAANHFERLEVSGRK